MFIEKNNNKIKLPDNRRNKKNRKKNLINKHFSLGNNLFIRLRYVSSVYLLLLFYFFQCNDVCLLGSSSRRRQRGCEKDQNKKTSRVLLNKYADKQTF